MDGPRIFTPEYYQRMRDLESASWWNAGMRDVAGQLMDLAALPSTGRLLDIGCGSGQTMVWFAKFHPGWTTVGLDVAVDGLRAAKALGLDTVLKASALHLPLPSQSIDFVVTLDVLQHLPLDGGDRTALSEIARVLKPGGHLLVRTNAQAFPHTADDPEFQFHKYRRPELRKKLEDAGFRVVRLSRVNALLGLAEIPRELRALNGAHAYHGLLSEARPQAAWIGRLKRAWLRLEGRAVQRGVTCPIGRTFVALCQR